MLMLLHVCRDARSMGMSSRSCGACSGEEYAGRGFSHAWKSSFQSVRILPRLGVDYGKKGLLLASDFAAAFGGRGYTVRAIATHAYMSTKKHLIIWGWMNE